MDVYTQSSKKFSVTGIIKGALATILTQKIICFENW
jgi:hypothetical protein